MCIRDRYEDAIRSDLEQAETLASCRTYEEIRLGLSGLSFARLSPKKDESVDEEKMCIRDRFRPTAMSSASF